MHKGQIFSIDFLIAMGIVVLLIGTILLATEKQNFYQTEENEHNKLTTKINNGLLALFATGEYDCNLENQRLKYSLDINKLIQKKATIKQKIGLIDYNVQLIIETDISVQILNEELKDDTIYALDMNILTCIDSNKLSYLDLFNCREGTCYSANLKERKLSIRVSK